MLLASDREGRLRVPVVTGERGSCPGCAAAVISKVGQLVRPHWAHHSSTDCDSWAGGETDWHMTWKQRALELGWGVEVSMREADFLHRADAVSPRDHVVEFQHSRLKPGELNERSAFYGARGVMCWVFDGGVAGWRSSWWDWVKGRQEVPNGIAYIALDEIGRALKARY